MNENRVSPEITWIPFMGMVIVTVLCIIAIYHEKKASDNLRIILSTDHLTGASNWSQFQKDCEEYLKKGDQKNYAMVTFDIDKFKAINDLYSHEVGNEILTAIAKSLAAFIGEEETFSRTSTDNFNILLKCHSQDELIRRIEDLIEEIKNNAHVYAINISVGICLIKDKTLDINILSDRANMARRSIKNNCEKEYTFYTDSMRHNMLKEKGMENRMTAALGNREFEMYLQPKYLFSDDKIIGAEALVRWNCPGIGIIPPSDFIPLFEKNGFVKQIDTYMFEEACKLLEKWKNESVDFLHLTISVNFSRLHLNNLFLSKELSEIAERYHIDPKLIEIELTENTIFDNENQMVTIMNDLKESGFQISIDDFGRAYSSLNTLKNLPADILKLDKEFFEGTSATNLRGKKIIMSILKMARDLDLVTVAEGVETLEQVDFLKEMGCDIAQGFYYARPMQVADFEAFITNKLQLV
ncbi:hypothetical protein AKG39_04245 [Acetobacterium bakii]|uniref:Diguanylate cyclase n=1 Tax=Acetobacterium bakii TaxID=52689 RepID=A0A0L6U3B7_9FIRM|nr:hypothetical protein AKG39_04245 [Acetobacterium bakii]